MRMSELAERSGVSVATIKYYLREGLLPAGESTAATQASYDDSHLERLRLIRVLREIGQVPVAAVRSVLEAVDDPKAPLPEVIGLAHHALARCGGDVGGLAADGRGQVAQHGVVHRLHQGPLHGRLVEQARHHDEVARDPDGVLLAQGPQFVMHRAVELFAGDPLGDARLGQTR